MFSLRDINPIVVLALHVGSSHTLDSLDLNKMYEQCYSLNIGIFATLWYLSLFYFG